MVDEIIRPYLTTRKLYPENQETPIHAVNMAALPEELFYLRNHFAYPSLHEESLRLHIAGEGLQPRVFDLNQIRMMPSRTVPVVLECAGNKRSFFKPGTFGEQWEKGAVNQGIWKGVPLSYLLQMAGLKASAREVVAEGWDYGTRTDLPGMFTYARSLPIDKAKDADTLIAYEYDGKPIPYKHGFPFRLIVPHWYAMASVKWVRRITVIDHSFQGPFQTIDYQYYPEKNNDAKKTPVTILHVNSSIQRPADRSTLRRGKHTIEGIAWTGLGEIKRVQLSFDGGNAWVDARLWRLPHQPRNWVHWRYEWDAVQAGEYSVISRAEDTNGRIQPMEAFWNRKGYGYNAADQVRVNIE